MEKAIVFDALAYAKKLIGAGVPPRQAEIHAETFAEIIEGQIATKRDLKKMEARLTASIVKWIAGMLLAQAAIVATLVKLL